MERRCSQRVFDRTFGYQCQKKAVIERDGKPYCKIHDPEYIKAKRDAQQAKFEAEWAEKEARWILEKARKDATKGLTLKELQQATPELIRGAIQQKGVK